MGEHYSDGRRYSHISKTWILNDSWNEREEIAFLKNEVDELTAKLNTARHDAVHAFITGKDKLCLVCGAKEPCELKDDPNSPCTFDPTPMELYKRCNDLTVKLTHSEHMLEHYRTEFEQTRSALLSVQSAMAHDNADLTRRLDEAQGLVTKAQDLATTRGEAIATLTERWAERRRFYKTKYREACKQRDTLQAKLAESEKAAYDVSGVINGLKAKLAATEQERDELEKLTGESADIIQKFEKSNDALQARLAVLEGALELYKQASCQSHNGHFDMTGQSGNGCPECIRARELREQAEAVLLAGKE